MVNMAKLWLQDQVDLIPLARDTLDKGITQAEKTLNDFAGVSGWSPSLANTTKKPASSSISGSWSKSLTPSSRLLMDMFRDHGGQLSIIGNTPTINPAEDLLNDLLAAVTNEAHVLGAVFNQLQDLIQQFASLTIEDILKKILAIVADGVLSSVQVVLDALLNVLYTLAQSAIKIMEAKIHIPVLSDLLNLAGFKDISFLDVFAWIGAFAVTVGYKTIEGHAPFPKDDRSVKSITAARSWDELCGMFGQQSTKGIISSFSSSSVSHASVVSNASQHQGPIPMSVSLQKATFECCHMISGILRLVGNPQLALEAYDDTGSSLIGIPATVVGIMDAAFNFVGNSLVPMDAVESLPIRILSAITGLLVVHSKVTFSGVGQWAFKKCNFGPMIFEDARGIGAMLDGVLVIPAMVVTLWHFYELAQKPSGATRSVAIVEEVSSIASYVSRLAYAFAVNDEEPDSRGIALVVMAAANDIYGGLQVTEYVIDNPAFN
ncbi:hypothetical protein TrVGV298_007953 [Trichoderma virens]|nr:hypothetical protein TrVGV298_007953 [Trichoderma virens]